MNRAFDVNEWCIWLACQCSAIVLESIIKNDDNIFIFIWTRTHAMTRIALNGRESIRIWLSWLSMNPFSIICNASIDEYISLSQCTNLTQYIKDFLWILIHHSHSIDLLLLLEVVHALQTPWCPIRIHANIEYTQWHMKILSALASQTDGVFNSNNAYTLWL